MFLLDSYTIDIAKSLRPDERLYRRSSNLFLDLRCSIGALLHQRSNTNVITPSESEIASSNISAK